MGKRQRVLAERYSSFIRSFGSGSITLDGSEQTICEQGGGTPSKVSGYIDLTNLIAGDVVEVKLAIKLKTEGPWRCYHEESYSGPMTTPVVFIQKKPENHGLQVSIKQTAGIPKEIDYEFFEEL